MDKKKKTKSASKAKTTSKTGGLAALRKKAQKQLSEQSARLDTLSRKDIKHLVNELGTHQIELEMQNEELRRAGVEIETSQAKYVDLYDFSPVGYFTLDRNGLIQELNLTGANMLGMEKRFLRAKPFQNFIDPAHRTVFHEHLSKVFATQTNQICEITIRKRDDTVSHVQLHSLSFHMGEGDPGVCRTAVSDETERKRAEEALMTAHAELEVANRDLEAFSYAVSHDLRAPLRTIEGFTTAILEDHAASLDETAADYLQRVTSASRRMSQLIDAMLNMARLTRTELRENTVDLSALAEVAAYELKKKEPDRQIEFLVAKGVKARGDISLLRVVLENLLDNSWKFSTKQPFATIEFGSTHMDGRDVYFVRDDGAGFPMEFMDKLFKPFSRLHTESEFPGLGIGLTTVQRIIQRHGGRIWAEGAVGKGATFFFTLG
jgi:PAS domain S-box-containing protein